MVGAKRARTAETLKPPSLYLRLHALYFYPTNAYPPDIGDIRAPDVIRRLKSSPLQTATGRPEAIVLGNP